MFSIINENHIYLIDAFDYEAEDHIDCELGRIYFNPNFF